MTHGHDPLSILAAAGEVPERTALIVADDGGRSITYAEMARLVGQEVVAGGGPEPIVATAELATVVRVLACIEAGRPVALLHPRWTEAETAAARAQIAAHDPAADPLGGCLCIVYTSGTSGLARGVVLGREAMPAAARAAAANLGWRDDDRWLLCLPLAHVGGLSVLLRCLCARKTVVLAERFVAADLPRWIERDRVTLVSLVPAMLARLLEEHPSWLPPGHLRAVLLGGDGVSLARLSRAVERGFPVLTTYGLTEACSQVTTQRPGAAPGADSGYPLDSIELRIVEGRIQVRGPALMTAYFPRAAHPSPFSADGWLETGDIGRIDAQGRLHVLGRWDDRIVTGGETIHPREVEIAIEEHAAIREACVFGVADERWGEIVAAALVPRAEPPSDRELSAFLATRLAPFRRPRLIAFVHELLRGPSGKIDRRAARATPGLRTL
jgi:o-succinylbenzoate---CoA ligase